MKKCVNVIIAMLVIIISMTACGEKKNNYSKEIVGKWECKEMFYQGNPMDSQEIGLPIAAVLQLEFKDDNTGEMIVIGSQNETFEWSAKEKTFEITVAGETVTVTKNDDVLNVIQGEGENITEFNLIKVDEFTEISIDDILAE